MIEYPYGHRVDTPLGEAVIYTDKFVPFNTEETRVRDVIVKRYINNDGHRVEGNTGNARYPTLMNFKYIICSRDYVPEPTQPTKASAPINRDMIATYPYEYVVHFEDFSTVVKAKNELTPEQVKEILSDFLSSNDVCGAGIIPTQYVVFELEIPETNVSDNVRELNGIIETQKQTILQFTNVVESLLNILKTHGVTHI